MSSYWVPVSNDIEGKRIFDMLKQLGFAWGSGSKKYGNPNNIVGIGISEFRIDPRHCIFFVSANHQEEYILPEAVSEQMLKITASKLAKRLNINKAYNK